MRKFVAELIGTFALVFAGTGAIIVNDASNGQIGHVGIALTFGLVVMAMIYALGEVSGAHLNPAVTLGFSLAGRLSWSEVPRYLAAQLTGAAVASVMFRLLFPQHATLGATIPSGSVMQSLVFETILTALLMLVILCVAHGAKETGIMAGIAIGATVGLEAMFAGPISGASMNPARSLAPAFVSGNVWEVWIYVAGPLIGAAIAVPIHRVLYPSNAQSTNH